MMDITILNTIKEYLDDCHLEYPAIVHKPDLAKFAKQPCDLDIFEFEMVKQNSGGGITGDSFSGQMAFPLGDDMFILIDYCM